MSCYWPAHKPVFDLGIDGWWPDQGDGLDAPSRLARNRMYFDGCASVRARTSGPTRSIATAAPGMQRYAAFLWSGDVYSTWETLKTHVPVAVNTGLSGLPYWGTDIGGFVPTKELTGELYVRWFQFGAFCPLFRSHGRTWKLRLPWGWNTGELGPDEVSNYTGGAADPDPSELHNAAVEPICRKYLELRYRLLPYLYSVVREGHVTGLPIVRALWLHHADDPLAAARGDEYLWGRDILVAPVVEKGATSRRVYLPRGAWHDFWTERRLDGGREVDRAVDLATMPLYVRAGAIVPLGPVRQYTGERVDEPTTLRIYPGADGAFLLYDDDGRSFAYERGDWMGIDCRWDDARRTLTLALADGSRMRPPARAFRVEVAGRLHDSRRRASRGVRSRFRSDSGASRAGVEHLAHLPDDRVRRERLLQERHARVEHAVVHDRIVGVARRVEHRRLGMALLQHRRHRPAAHLWQHDVGQDQMDRPVVSLGEFDGPLRRRRGVHRVALPGQHLEHEFAHDLFVLDEENRLDARERARIDRRSCPGRLPPRRCAAGTA